MTQKTNRKPIGRAVQRIRIQKALTQEEVCNMANVSRNRIINVESGEVGYNIDSLLAILEVLGAEIRVEDKDLYY